MTYYLDTEFNGFGGILISLALVRDDGETFYFINKGWDNWDAPEVWVKENIVPILYDVPDNVKIVEEDFHTSLMKYLKDDSYPIIITDWPDDIRYFCDFIMTGPGMMINIPALEFRMIRCDAYPTTVPGAIQHNAYWDAIALRQKYKELYYNV